MQSSVFFSNESIYLENFPTDVVKFILCLFTVFFLSPLAFAEESSKCGSGTVYDPSSNSCILEKNPPDDDLQKSSESEKRLISPWVKNNAAWLSNGAISDSDFSSMLSYLIQEGNLIIESNLESQTIHTIPDWVKNNAAWWADGAIDDDSFIQGVEYMAKNGMLTTTPPTHSSLSNVIGIQKESTKNGLEITFANIDSNSHTVTSGNLITGPDGKFDTSLLQSGNTFTFTSKSAETLQFFCMVHPWESGTITITDNDLQPYLTELERQNEIKQQKLEEEQDEIQRNQLVNDIKSEFEYAAIDTLTTQLSEKDVEDFKEFLGEERYQKLQEFNEKYGSGFNAQTPLALGISGQLSLEEEFFVVELTEFWVEFFKQKMSLRIGQLDILLDETKSKINQLDISTEEKLQHIKDVEEKKSGYVMGFTNGMRNILLLEDEITQKKKELELRADLEGKSLGFNSPMCGEGTIEKNGQCVVDPDLKLKTKPSLGGGCLIATATYGTELAPQVQQLRELRDNQLLQTESGTSFMNTFNDFYYSFSPIIADYERENPMFREIVKITITPMITSLSLMEYADSEESVLGIGISLIILNLGMYFVAPMIIIWKIRQ